MLPRINLDTACYNCTHHLNYTLFPEFVKHTGAWVSVIRKQADHFRTVTYKKVEKIYLPWYNKSG